GTCRAGRAGAGVRLLAVDAGAHGRAVVERLTARALLNDGALARAGRRRRRRVVMPEHAHMPVVVVVVRRGRAADARARAGARHAVTAAAARSALARVLDRGA